ncbi:MAG: hypothetical protein KGL39_14870 [Patescibacteria group bacterium]|nr:hypothetical protein [Patescibacteria group bacterium]
MSKNKQSTNPSPTTGWGWGYVIAQDQISYVQGRLLTLIESFGMKDTQEKAAKDLISQALWEIYHGAITLDTETHSKLRIEDMGKTSGVGSTIPRG